jgi:hypothetical protein
MPHATTYAKLRALSTAQLVQLYDDTSKDTVVGLDSLREEIFRREAAEQTVVISKMTRQMRDLTIVITLLTIVNIVCAAIPLFK